MPALCTGEEALVFRRAARCDPFPLEAIRGKRSYSESATRGGRGEGELEEMMPPVPSSA